ncbi:peroxiredoxin family protein [Tessaracoccus sp. OS52]|uniref:peroxiredoxin family protein n=1 Tax=Tessaracoccus sp. OS52 TaxID=2886691 RepID=UPI001D10F86B|nr:peroxiredoxin family protein [Tessaracoccus sp. OS52]MCC2594157.1 peroxiredoxin family protein [Tessaracoccus sp. OS52]
MTQTRPERSRRAQLRAQQESEQQRTRRTRSWTRVISAVVAVVVLGITGYGLWTAVPEQGDTSHLAPDFTLPTTDGTTVTLSALRPNPVIIYFNEGAGCASCTMQMAEIEKNPGFAEAGIEVIPIVMNTAEQILPDMQQFGVTTPYLLDDGTVSKAYDVLDKGMHPGMPGHGFVLIDGEGVQRWYGNYPSMWLDPQELLDEALDRLG